MPRPGAPPSRRSANGVRFAQADVTSEEQVQAAIALAVSAFGNLSGVVNAAGIGPAAKVVGKNGPHSLDLFEKTVRVNLVGTFNVIRLAAAVMIGNPPLDIGRARGHHQYRVDCGLRWADRPACLCGLQGRHRRPDPAGGEGVRGDRHQVRDDRAGNLRHSSPRRAARSRAGLARTAGALPVTARPAPPNTVRWSGTSSRTRCSTAR